MGLVRYDFGGGQLAYGGHGGVPGYTTIAMRTTAGRCVVLYENGIDLHAVLTSDCAFITASMAH